MRLNSLLREFDWQVLIAFIILNVLGLIGYYLGFDYYTIPSDYAINTLALYFAVFFATFLVVHILVFPFLPSRSFVTSKIKHLISVPTTKQLYWINFVTVVSITFTFVYGIIFFKSMPYSNLISQLGESGRPDIVVGGPPFFWSFSVFVTSILMPLVCNKLIMLFKQKKKSRELYIYMALFFPLSFILTDKSTLMMCTLFVMYHSFKRKSYFLVLAPLIFVFFYGFIKYLFYPTRDILDFFELQYIAPSIFRRVSFINVSGMGIVLDNLRTGVDYPSAFASMKQYVFYKIYGTVPGGVPVQSFVSDFYYFPTWIVLIVIVLTFGLFLLYRRLLLVVNKKNTTFHFAIKYLLLYGAILYATSDLRDLVVRFIIPSIVLGYFSFHRFKLP